MSRDDPMRRAEPELTEVPGELARLCPDADGAYTWDHWQMRALSAGLEHRLSQLGRAVMREAVQHNWPTWLKAECGWEDEGQDMLELAQLDPETAERRWQWLLETDGGRVEWDAAGERFRALRPDIGLGALQSVEPAPTRTELRMACLLLWRALDHQELSPVEWLVVGAAVAHCRSVLGVSPTGHYVLSERRSPR